MIFARLTPRNKQDYMALLRPHMAVLEGKAHYWTRSRRQADQLLDGFLLRMTAEMEAMKKTDNLRLWLVKSLFEEFSARLGETPRDARNLLDKETILANFFPPRADAKPLPGSPFALAAAQRHETGR